jgi:hypothetical protein
MSTEPAGFHIIRHTSTRISIRGNVSCPSGSSPYSIADQYTYENPYNPAPYYGYNTWWETRGYGIDIPWGYNGTTIISTYDRISRAVESDPKLEGLIKYEDLPYDDWEVYNFLEPVFIDGVPVFYAPSSVLPANEMLVGYRGDMWFEAPLVYAPFIPVTTVSTAGQPGNVFINNVGVAHGAGLETVSKGFVQRITLI